jgi:hypothetical protein
VEAAQKLPGSSIQPRSYFYQHLSHCSCSTVPSFIITPTGKMNSKHDVDPMVSEAHENDYELQNKSKLAGTDTDVLEMRAMGKTQQLNVRKTFVSDL